MTIYLNFNSTTSSVAFYDSDINPTIPDTAVEITKELHQYLLDGQSQGKIISAGEDGQPVLVDPPVIPFDPAPLIQQVRDAREVVLNRLSGIALAAQVSGDSDTVSACMKARTGLLNITSVVTAETSVSYDSLKQAFVEAYLAIVEEVPTNIKNAFSAFLS